MSSQVSRCGPHRGESALTREHRDTRFLGNRSSSGFFHRCLVHWLLVRCQRHTSRVQEAFVGFGYQKPTHTPAHVSLVKQSMLLCRDRKEPSVKRQLEVMRKYYLIDGRQIIMGIHHDSNAP
jgi:hypothetical protein